MPQAQQLQDRVLGSPVFSRLSGIATSRNLRILAYHDVPDADAFAVQLGELARRWSVVGEEIVLQWLAGHAALPANAVWITFDDGDPTLIHNAMPLLQRHGFTATAFVCPGLIESGDSHWWQVIEAAKVAQCRSVDLGIEAHEVPPIPRLKALPDADRRSVVDRVRSALDTAGVAVGRGQWSDDDLNRWVAAGNSVGNHSWDHPCLDQCSVDEQRRQVEWAHEALTERLGYPPRTFAWPNGN